MVDLTLKIHEKGKNSIGLNGGVSGLEGAFVGINYATNNFLGLGETLQVQASVGNLARSVRFGFTEPYMFDRPLQFGFNVYYTKISYDQARQLSIFSGQTLNLPNTVLQNLQNYTQSSAGFTTSLSYPLRRRSFKRVGITYSFDRSSLLALSSASKNLFEFLAFRGISGPNALEGIITSKIFPNFSFNTIDSPISPHPGTSSRWARNSLGWEARFARFGRSCNTSSSSRCRTGATRWASTFRDRSSPATAAWLRRRSSALTWAARTICAASIFAPCLRWHSCRA